MHKIKLLNLNFPNGEHRKATLVPFGTIDWHLAKTGKGTTQVMFKGKNLEVRHRFSAQNA
jgi:hypothetical protein